MVNVASVLDGIALYQAHMQTHPCYTLHTELDVLLYIVSDDLKKSTGVKDPTLHPLCPARMLLN